MERTFLQPHTFIRLPDERYEWCHFDNPRNDTVNIVKGVILVSKGVPGELGEDGAVQRVKEICRLIKSLPEAQKIPIFAAVNSEDDYGCFPRLYGGRNSTNESWSLQFPATEPPVLNSSKVGTPVSFGGPLTLIVFGGEAVEATAFFLEKDEEIEQNPRFTHWKAKEYGETVSGAKQVIGFCDNYLIIRRNGQKLLHQLICEEQWMELHGYDMTFGFAKPQTNVEEVFSRTEQCEIGFFVIGFQ